MALQRREKEVKYIDDRTMTGTTLVLTSGNMVDVNLIANGPDIDERIGRRAKMISWRTKMQIRDAIEAQGYYNPGAVRCIWFVDYKTRGATPTVADLLASSGSNDYLSFPNLNEKERFRILCDRTYKFGNFTVDATPELDVVHEPSVQHDEVYLKLDVETVFGADAAAIASIEQGSLHFLAIASQAGAYYITAQHRVAFID